MREKRSESNVEVAEVAVHRRPLEILEVAHKHVARVLRLNRQETPRLQVAFQLFERLGRAHGFARVRQGLGDRNLTHRSAGHYVLKPAWW